MDEGNYADQPHLPSSKLCALFKTVETVVHLPAVLRDIPAQTEAAHVSRLLCLSDSLLTIGLTLPDRDRE